MQHIILQLLLYLMAAINIWFSGGGDAFPYTGSAQITGSLGVTGSVDTFIKFK